MLSLLLAVSLPATNTLRTGRLRVHHVQMKAVSAGTPYGQVEECISESKNGDEAIECMVPWANPTSSHNPSRRNPRLLRGEMRSTLMGAATDVDECVSESESAAERNECLLDYDMLVSGATPSLNSDGIIEMSNGSSKAVGANDESAKGFLTPALMLALAVTGVLVRIFLTGGSETPIGFF